MLHLTVESSQGGYVCHQISDITLYIVSCVYNQSRLFPANCITDNESFANITQTATIAMIVLYLYNIRPAFGYKFCEHPNFANLCA